MPSFIARGKYRDLINDPHFRENPDAYRSPDAVDMPDLGEGAFFDPNLQVVVTGKKKPKAMTTTQEAQSEPTVREAKPEDQLAFFDGGGYDNESDPYMTLNKSRWLEQFHKEANKRKYKNLAEWAKFVSSVRGQGVEYLGTQNIQGTMHDAAVRFMPGYLKREYEALKKKREAKSKMREQFELAKEMGEEAKAAGYEYDPKYNALKTIKEKESRTDKMKNVRDEQIQDIRDFLTETPDTIAVVEKGKKYDALRDPKKIRVVGKDFLQQRGDDLEFNSDKYEQIELGGKDEMSATEGIMRTTEWMSDRDAQPGGRVNLPGQLDATEPILTEDDIQDFVSDVSIQFPDATEQELTEIMELLQSGAATTEEIIAALQGI